MSKKYASKEEKLLAGVHSVLWASCDLGCRPKKLRRGDWSRNKPKKSISKNALNRDKIVYSNIREKAELCLPPATDSEKWPENYPIASALAEAWHVVYKKPRVIKPKVEPQPKQDPVDAFEEKSTIRDLRKENKELLKQIVELQEREAFLLGASKESKGIPILQERSRTRLGKRQGTAKCFCSDVHFEEVIDSAQVYGANKYNTAIAKKRLEKLAEGVIWKTESHRTGYDIHQLIQTFGGDMITGYLRAENMQTNSMGPLKAVMELKDILIQYLLLLLEEGKFEKIIVPCLCGNHGRIGEKLQSKNFVENSFEWIMYEFMAQQLAHEERIEFLISKAEHQYTKVFDFIHRDTHGTKITYRGGRGKATIPLYTRLESWDRGIKANVTWAGHLHSYLPHPDAILNGSICGWNEFAAGSFGFEDPQQAYGIIDSQRGLRDVVALWVDDKWDHQLREV